MPTNILSKSKRTKTTRSTEFSFLAPQATAVYLAGDFNLWDPESLRLKKDKKGNWKVKLDLPLGRYEYRFFVDGVWQNDSQCTQCVANSFGTWNCVRIIE